MTAMNACIQAQLPDKQDLQEPDIILETGEIVEIVALPTEQTQEALHIIQERHDMGNPLRVAAKQLKCSVEGIEDGDASKKKGKAAPQFSVANMVTSKLPCLQWVPQLTLAKVRADLIAGMTVGVMVIPQGMSYANIAGLPYIYGMYSACVPTFIYALFGQSRQLAVGPVAMVSLLVEAGLRDVNDPASCGDNCEDAYIKLAILASLAVGLMQIVASVLRLGFLVSFLGHPVTSGFTSAAAIIIGLSQVKYIFGFDIEKSQFVYVTVGAILRKIGEINPWTFALGILSIAFLMVTRKVARGFPKVSLLGPLGPLILCTIGIIFLTIFEDSLQHDHHVKAVGKIPSGIMPFSVTDWNLGDLGLVMPTAMSACLIGYMESIAIGKNLAAKNGYEIEAGQELFALGAANVVGACFSCYPVTGSFSRSAVNQMTGAATQLAGVVTSFVILLTLLFLTPIFTNLPKFVLAAIVINSVIPLVAYEEARKLWRIKKNDCLLWVVAFIGTLFLGVLMGIALAVALSLVIVIYESVRPQITILWRIPGTTIYRNVKQETSGAFVPNVFIARIGSSMYFANASYIKDMLVAYVADMEEVNKIEYIVLEMTPVVSLDTTAVHVIHDIVSEFRSRHIQIAFALVGNRVEKTLRKANLKSFIGDRWFFASVNDAVHYCLRHQYARRMRRGGDPELGSVQSMEFKDEVVMEPHHATVHPSNEVGFSNDIHHACTTVFINIVRDVQGIMGEITAVFKKNQIVVVRALVEPLHDSGAKHTYFVKSAKTDGKLSEWEVERLRDELGGVMARMHEPEEVRKEAFSSRVSSTAGRVDALEKALLAERSSNQKVYQQLQEQTKRLNVLLGGAVDLEGVVVQLGEAGSGSTTATNETPAASESGDVRETAPLARNAVRQKQDVQVTDAPPVSAMPVAIKEQDVMGEVVAINKGGRLGVAGMSCFSGLDCAARSQTRSTDTASVGVLKGPNSTDWRACAATRLPGRTQQSSSGVPGCWKPCGHKGSKVPVSGTVVAAQPYGHAAESAVAEAEAASASKSAGSQEGNVETHAAEVECKTSQDTQASSSSTTAEQKSDNIASPQTIASPDNV